MAENENTFLNADNIYEDVEGEQGKTLDLKDDQTKNLIGLIKTLDFSDSLNLTFLPYIPRKF